MFGWDQWKKGFERWENATAQYLEQVLKSPAVLVPAGAMLTAGMRFKAAVDASLEVMLAAMRLPTRGDQERTLHQLNQLQSQLFDLREKLEDLEQRMH
jgi:TolA-binding protein